MDSTPRVSDSVGLMVMRVEVGWRICISNKFPVMLTLLSGDCTLRTTDLYYSNREGNQVGTSGLI